MLRRGQAQGSYRFRVDKNGTQYWSGAENHCTVPGCNTVNIFTTVPVTVTVADTGETLEAGLTVYAFNGSTYTGFSAKTNAQGQAVFTLPGGEYRFRADKNGTQFWSAAENDCSIPGCTVASVTTTIPVVVTVLDTGGTPEVGLNVYAFDGTTYTNFSGKTDASGQVTFTLPQGSYRFRADKNGTQFWSGAENDCSIPGCTAASIKTTIPVVVTVRNSDDMPEAGLHVYAFDGITYTNYSGTTNASGQVTLTLPQGEYRFRVDKNGTQFWSSAGNDCGVPGCVAATVETTIPVTVTVLDPSTLLRAGMCGAPQVGLHVYAFDGTTYTNFSGTTNAEGQVTMTLPQGEYRFRADKDGNQYWSGAVNHCSIPGCLNAAITLPGGGAAAETRTITYTYDSLYRLINADYNSGEYFHYTYDDVGNRLTEEKKTTPAGTPQVTDYTYDDANRMTSAGGVTYEWDNNGNLINDDTYTYAYNHSNKLTMVQGPSSIVSFTYNGLGDRLSETINGVTTIFTLDLNTGLTQVLADGSHVYLYGLGRIAQIAGSDSVYFLGDALGSVRQLADGQGIVILARSYEPYGSVLSTAGEDATKYGFTGEWQENGLVFLRDRYYTSGAGIFTSHDSWEGDESDPASYNAWNYIYGNPIRYKDPSGKYCIEEGEAPEGMKWSKHTCEYISITPGGRTPSESENLDQSFYGDSYFRFDRSLEYIYGEMMTNSQGNIAKLMREMLMGGTTCNDGTIWGGSFSAVVGSNWGAYAIFYQNVRTNGPWDHKPMLRAMLSIESEQGWYDLYYPIRSDQEFEYFYDIWSNIHYGYVGASIGFDRATLQYFSNLEKYVPEWAKWIVRQKFGQYDPGDEISVNIGVDLWDEHGYSLVSNDIHRAILARSWEYFNSQDKNKNGEIDENEIDPQLGKLIPKESKWSDWK